MKFLRMLTKSELFSFFLSVIFLLFLGTAVKNATVPTFEDAYTIRYTATEQVENASPLPEEQTEKQPLETVTPASEAVAEVPASQEESAQTAETATEETGMVNLNTATAEELDTLSGIGEVLAQRIIEYRTINNGFSTVEELMEVKGIGEKTFEKNRDRICVSDS